ncbi:hypothetical protein [Roseateles sp. PN1]|uniref:hypothetical protein n=1 Tax=Roseateles sp. PN1 TaxID=3137372 RepID=UPI0031398937
MIRAYVAIALLAGSFGAGWIGHMRWANVDRLKTEIAAAEAARESERTDALKQAQTLSDYAARLKRESSAAAAARSDLDRLRNALATGPEAPADSCGPERARIRVLSDVLAEGAGLAAEGRGHVEQLRADRAALVGESGR